MIVTAIDPGMSTGIARLEIQSLGTITQSESFQVEGGLRALLEGDWLGGYLEGTDVLVVEKFSTRAMARSYRLNELEPIRIEGAIEELAWCKAIEAELVFRLPGERSLLNGKPISASNKVLEAMGMLSTGSMVGCKDANDANAAMLHAVAYLRDQKSLAMLSILQDAMCALEGVAEYTLDETSTNKEGDHLV